MARIPQYSSRRDSDRSASSDLTRSSGWAACSGTASGDSQRRFQESTDLPHGPARGGLGMNPICKDRLWMLLQCFPCSRHMHRAELMQAGRAALTPMERVCSAAARSWDAAPLLSNQRSGWLKGVGQRRETSLPSC